jgi:hypothetical protein
MICNFRGIFSAVPNYRSFLRRSRRASYRERLAWRPPTIETGLLGAQPDGGAEVGQGVPQLAEMVAMQATTCQVRIDVLGLLAEALTVGGQWSGCRFSASRATPQR